MSSRGGGEEAPHESGSLACSNVQLLGRTRSGLSLRCNALQCTVGRSAGENERREENNWIIGRGTHVLVYLVFGIIDPCYSSVLGRHWKAWTSRETGTLKIFRPCSPQHRRGARQQESGLQKAGKHQRTTRHWHRQGTQCALAVADANNWLPRKRARTTGLAG